MTTTFTSTQEFRDVVDRAFQLMNDDPDMGPGLRTADVPHTFEFDDVGLCVSVRASRDDERGNLVWSWASDVDWEPRVRMRMSSEVAVRYFQGQENMAMALARRRIRASGDVMAALRLVPLTKPLFALYRAMLDAEYPHLRT